MVKGRRGVRAWVVGVVCLLVWGAAGASTVIPNGTTALNYVTGGVQLVDGPGAGTFIGRTFGNPSVAARTVPLSEQVGLTLAQRNLVATVGRTLSFAEIMGPAAAIGGAAWAGWQIGTGIAKTLGLGDSSNGTRCVPTSDGWQCDAGAEPTPGTSSAGYRIDMGGSLGSVSSASYAGACEAARQKILADYIQQYPSSSNHTATTVTCTATQFTYNRTRQSCNQYGCTPINDGNNTLTLANITITSPSSCPASIDALDPRLSRPAGDAPGPDGKCATGRYNSATATAVAQKVATYGDPSTLKDLAQSVLDKGGTITTASPREITSVTPQSITGTPTTSTRTNPDGSTVTTTETPTITFTPDHDTIRSTTTTTTVTNTCTGANSCQTTTSSTAAPTPKEEQPGNCDQYPDSVGCAKAGEPPSAEQMPSESKTITFSTLPFASGGSCPNGLSFAVFGRTYTVSYGPLCTLLATLAPLFLFTGAAAAALIFADGIRA